MQRLRGVHWGVGVFLFVTIVLGGGATAAQAPQGPNPTLATWIDLPTGSQATTPPSEANNTNATEMHILDVAVNGHLRVWYTTEGWIKKSGFPPIPVQLFPGRLRPVDIRLPVPDLTALDEGAWPQGFPADWTMGDHVANWNATLGDDASALQGKRNSLVGLISRNGTLFVPGPSVNRLEVGGEGQPWNGLSMLDGTTAPDESFNPLDLTTPVGKELWSAGDGGPADGGEEPELREAVPEGTSIFSTQPAGATLSHFLAVANYCGPDVAGTVMVQNISNMTAVNPAARALVPLYEFLGDFRDTDPQPYGPYGAEVERIHFTCPISDGLPDCPDGVDDVGGNKIRPVLVVDVPSAASFNPGKKFGSPAGLVEARRSSVHGPERDA